MAALVALLSLSLVACSTSQVVLDIEIAADVVAIGAPIVAAFGGPGAAQITTYMTAAANGLNCVLVAAQAAGATTATISAAFATCLAQVAVPILPAGTPPQVGAIITAVSVAISVLVSKYGPKTAPATAERSVFTSPAKVKLTMSDNRKISGMHKRLDAAISQLHGATK